MGTVRDEALLPVECVLVPAFFRPGLERSGVATSPGSVKQNDAR